MLAILFHSKSIKKGWKKIKINVTYIVYFQFSKQKETELVVIVSKGCELWNEWQKMAISIKVMREKKLL